MAYQGMMPNDRYHLGPEMYRTYDQFVPPNSSSPPSRPYHCGSRSPSPSSSCRSSCGASTAPSSRDKTRRKPKKCQGAECRRKTLSFTRPKPHWCDGKSWGGKIWGLSRNPGDRNINNWTMYFDPRVSKEEIQDICWRRCPPQISHRAKPQHPDDHHRHKTVVVEEETVETPPAPPPTMLPPQGVMTSAVPMDRSGPDMPPHRGYTGHPAGGLEFFQDHGPPTARSSARSNKSSSRKSSSSKSSSQGSSGKKSSKAISKDISKSSTKSGDGRSLGNPGGGSGGQGGEPNGGGTEERVASVAGDAGGAGSASGERAATPAPAAAASSASTRASRDESAAHSEREEREASPVASRDGLSEHSEHGSRDSAVSSPKEEDGAGEVSTEREMPGTRPRGASVPGHYRWRRDDSGRIRSGSWERVSPEYAAWQQQFREGHQLLQRLREQVQEQEERQQKENPSARSPSRGRSRGSVGSGRRQPPQAAVTQMQTRRSNRPAHSASPGAAHMDSSYLANKPMLYAYAYPTGLDTASCASRDTGYASGEELSLLQSCSGYDTGYGGEGEEEGDDGRDYGLVSSYACDPWSQATTLRPSSTPSRASSSRGSTKSSSKHSVRCSKSRAPH